MKTILKPTFLPASKTSLGGPLQILNGLHIVFLQELVAEMIKLQSSGIVNNDVMGIIYKTTKQLQPNEEGPADCSARPKA